MRSGAGFTALAVAVVIAAGVAPAQSNSAIQTLRVGADPDFRPVSFSDASGKLIGYDADFADALAKHLGATLEYQGMAWDGIIPALSGGKIDAITTLVITEKRKEVVAFSQPVIRQDVTEVVRADNSSNPTPQSLKTLKIGVQVNTSAETAIKKIPSLNVTTYNTVADEYNDLLLGRIDVVVIEDINAYYTTREAYAGKLRVTGVSLSSEPPYAGVAMRKDDAALQQAVNAAIAAMRADGSLAKIATKWFGDASILAPAAP
jgi:polar amino acid transport system substrate-binding protein